MTKEEAKKDTNKLEMSKEEVIEIRDKLEMTKFNFAVALNVSYDLITSIINGRRKVSRITAEKIEGLAKSRGISIGDE